MRRLSCFAALLWGCGAPAAPAPAATAAPAPPVVRAPVDAGAAASPEAANAVAALEAYAATTDCAAAPVVPRVELARAIESDPALAARRQKAVELIAGRARTCPP